MTNESTDKQLIIKAVREHAVENYEKGWDYIVECYSDVELEALIFSTHKARTLKDAIKKLASDVKMRKEAESNAW